MKEKLISLGIDHEKIIEEPNGKYSIRGNVDWCRKLKVHGAIPVPLHHVYGNFIISENDLNSLNNAPSLVLGIFDCSHNNISDFVSCPSYCQILKAHNNPQLIDIEHAPFITNSINLSLDKTRVAPFALQVYKFACEAGTWDASRSWEENMKLICKAKPSECKKRWPKEFEEYIFPHRGASISENLGIV
jgi:hypothetical protein